MELLPVGIFGASGYSGVVASRLLAAHPRVQLRFLTSDRWGGEAAADRSLARTPLHYVSAEEGEIRARDCALVFLATPAETSLALLPRLRDLGVKTIDLSGAFRLRDPAAYSKFYGFEHTAPALLERGIYGLTETHRSRIGNAEVVANPGCYATAAALALIPLFESALVDPTSVTIYAASGVTGAGRKATEDFSFGEIDGDFRAYRTLTHQHTPEIAQSCSDAAGSRVKVTFLPHLLSLRRGLLCTSVLQLRPGAGRAAVEKAFSRYAGEPFVRLRTSADAVRLHSVVGTNWCEIGFTLGEGEAAGQLIVTSAIDNLLKGASGQAVQNLNRMMGWDEQTGLENLHGATP